MTKPGEVPEMAKAIDSGRTIVVFPDIEVKFDGINMLEWSKLVELTIVGRELGDHLKESPVLEKDPRYRKLKAEEALIHEWILSTLNSKMMRDFLYVDYVKELWDEVSKYSTKKHYD